MVLPTLVEGADRSELLASGWPPPPTAFGPDSCALGAPGCLEPSATATLARWSALGASGNGAGATAREVATLLITRLRLAATLCGKSVPRRGDEGALIES